LWCAWLAWSRFRVVIPTWDKTIPTIAACLDATFRTFGGVPTYCLTDNEKTVTVEHVARVAVRNPDMAAIGRYYGTAVATCLPADPASKGGSEATVRIAKRDLVPTLVNLRAAYASFTELEQACVEFITEVNGRVHRETRQVPVSMLAEERSWLHLMPETPYTAVFGQTRTVNIKDGTVSVGSVRCSVPYQWAGQKVWVRFDGDELIVTGLRDQVPVELARHARSTPGNPRIDDAHYPQSSRGRRSPKAVNPAEAAFLNIGDGAAQWLMEAAAQGAARIRAKMAEAVTLAKLHGNDPVDRALGTAAFAGRFGEADLATILAYQHDPATTRAGETHSLQPGTSAWAQMGRYHTNCHGRGHPHRQSPTLGPSRARAHPAGRRSRRPRRGQPAHPPHPGGIPHRENVPHLERAGLVYPHRHPVGAANPGMGGPPREPVRLRPIRHRQKPLLRSARPSCRRRRPERGLVHHRRHRRTGTPPPRR
jgi:hypothetical protein